MRSVKFAMCIAALSLGVTVVSANAQQVADVQTCLGAAAHVRAALDANAHAANYEAAMKERNFGLAYCNNDFYAKGIEHYNRALQLLGARQDADAAH